MVSVPVHSQQGHQQSKLRQKSGQKGLHICFWHSDSIIWNSKTIRTLSHQKKTPLSAIKAKHYTLRLVTVQPRSILTNNLNHTVLKVQDIAVFGILSDVSYPSLWQQSWESAWGILFQKPIVLATWLRKLVKLNGEHLNNKTKGALKISEFWLPFCRVWNPSTLSLWKDLLKLQISYPYGNTSPDALSTNRWRSQSTFPNESSL